MMVEQTKPIVTANAAVMRKVDMALTLIRYNPLWLSKLVIPYIMVKNIIGTVTILIKWTKIVPRNSNFIAS